MKNQNSKNLHDGICMDIANSILLHDDEKSRLTIAQINKLIKIKSAEFKLDSIPKYSELIKYMPSNNYYKRLLRIKPVKTQSGVAVVTVMPMPYDCPHGKCIYCPGGKEYNTPLSYIGTEPSTIIAQKLNFNAYEQVRTKIKQLVDRGHEVSKVELVIVGGTFPFYPLEYQLHFAENLYRALNSFDEDDKATEFELSKSEKKSGTPFLEGENMSKKPILPLTPSSLKPLRELQEKNENAVIRCVGMTIETKPDYCKTDHVNTMLDLGTTRIELGIQSLSDEVYRMVNRGHSLNDVFEAFHISRNCGFKIGAHMMPGLPGSDVTKDLHDVVTLFDDERLKPDMLKIYPTLVVQNTGLYELYKRNNYVSYSTEDLVNLLVEVKKIIPPWVRIMRIQREIEPKDIVSGPKMGNIRQLVLNELKRRGIKCKCIRCREIGLLNQSIDILNCHPKLNRLEYTASGGKEIFLSYEIDNKDLLLGFLRLRIMTNPLRKELFKGNNFFDSSDFSNINNTNNKNNYYAIVRELHVYGPVAGISSRGGSTNSGRNNNQDSISRSRMSFDSYKSNNVENISKVEFQHKGLGRALLAEAEKICKDEYQIKALSVISAVGTRDYYGRFGYTNNGPYVTKLL